MFDEVTKQKRGKRVRSSAYIAASALLQALCVVALVLIAERFRAAAARDEPLITVKFFRPAPALPAAPPPPVASEPKPSHRPKVTPPKRPATALVQPKQLPEPRVPSATPEPEPENSGESPEGGGSGGVGGGSEGGVVGGVVGGQGTQVGVGDGPAYPGVGARKPLEATRGCVQSSIRIPRDLQGFVSGLIVVEFAIKQDGTPSHFRMLTQSVDERIAKAIWHAISSCEWVPGADANGKPEWFRATMPLRFKSG